MFKICIHIYLENLGHSTGRRRSNDEHLNRYHPHQQPLSYNFQRATQQQAFAEGHTVAQYYPPVNQHTNIPVSSSFQAPRLMSQSYSASATRNNQNTDHQMGENQRSHTAPNNSSSLPRPQPGGYIQDGNEKPKIPEIRTIVAVPETDILDDYSDNDDELIGADEHHERDDSINCEFY